QPALEVSIRNGREQLVLTSFASVDHVRSCKIVDCASGRRLKDTRRPGIAAQAHLCSPVLIEIPHDA
ncbi:MAG: hypothetical protein ABI633_13235, partial [Burkholderiales bacterium]